MSTELLETCKGLK